MKTAQKRKKVEAKIVDEKLNLRNTVELVHVVYIVLSGLVLIAGRWLEAMWLIVLGVLLLLVFDFLKKKLKFDRLPGEAGNVLGTMTFAVNVIVLLSILFVGGVAILHSQGAQLAKRSITQAVEQSNFPKGYELAEMSQEIRATVDKKINPFVGVSLSNQDKTYSLSMEAAFELITKPMVEKVEGYVPIILAICFVVFMVCLVIGIVVPLIQLKPRKNGEYA